MKKFLLIFLVAALYSLASCAEEAPAGGADELTIVTQSGETRAFDIELARTPEEKRRGLMNRKMLPPQSGMLFLFDGPERPLAFWMKNTLIPLDIIFIRAGGTINHIHPMAEPLSEKRIPSHGPVGAVLEINGGEAAALGIAPGDTVHHPAFGNKLAE